ncbi:zf-HC2 domain-containing protein [candidate division KSB1 bacterium]|nr:zf-HC2 domain-containing protein [candidate division KSB1 bacterium]RQW08053.1 MAG: hypothetical protein EH222_06200 [candidate division KSB1 bacterium]
MMMNHLNDDTMQDYLDGNISAREREEVRQHLEECEQCRDLLASYQDVFAALEREPDFELPKNFTRKVIRQTHKRAIGSLQFGLLQIFFILAAAIAVINVVLTYVQVDTFTATAKTTADAFKDLAQQLGVPMQSALTKIHFNGFFIVILLVGFVGLYLLDRFLLQPRFKPVADQ